ncbi:MAG: ribose-phosphate pyrophosphokinase [Bacilli bacterium]|nr:ribose-phosphate pyrophosphokinase [Bacilli bacterium]
MNNYIVFSLFANKKLANNVAKSLNCPLGDVSITHFADGEVLVKTESDVKDKEVILIESTSQRAQDKLFELLLLIDSLNRAGAKSIQLFIPYFGYSRQERSYLNEPVSCQVAAKIIETANYDSLTCFDLHTPLIKEFFDKGIKALPTSELFVTYYLNYFKAHNIDINDVVIVAPDHGSNERIEYVVKELNVHKVIMEKIRPRANVAEHLEIKDDVQGKTCIIIDDIIDTGGTVVSAANLLYQKGAHYVLVGASHAVISGNCLRSLREACIEDIVVTNTIEQSLPSDVHVVDILPLILREIK